jgi:hypothetical protein
MGLLPRQPTPPAAPLGLGLERNRPFALVGQGEPLCLFAPRGVNPVQSPLPSAQAIAVDDVANSVP